MWVATFILAMAAIETSGGLNRSQQLSEPGRAGVALESSRNPERGGRPMARPKERIPWTDSSRGLFNLSGG
jgi:hypothetical protein